MTYQEQVMQIARELAGYSLGEADLLRRAMGKKIASEMEAQRRAVHQRRGRARHRRGASPSRFSSRSAKFAGYGFNKGHAAAYALVAYQTAYLKANYPVEFLAALDDARYRQHRPAQHLPPGRRSGWASSCCRPTSTAPRPSSPSMQTAKGAAIRYALAAVKGVGAAGDGPGRRRSARRTARSRISSISRAGSIPKSFNRASSRAWSGPAPSMRSIPTARRALPPSICCCATPAPRPSERVEPAGQSLRRAPAARRPAPVAAADRRIGRPVERLQQEFDAIGFYLSSHPLDAYGKSLARVGVVRFAELPARLAAGGSTRFKLAGIVIGSKERTSARGSRFAFVQMSDTSGIFEVRLFSEVLAQAAQLLDSGKPLLGHGRYAGGRRGAAPDRAAVRAARQGRRRRRRRGSRSCSARRRAGAVQEPDAGEAAARATLTWSCRWPTREVEIALPGGFRIGPEVRRRCARCRACSKCKRSKRFALTIPMQKDA